MTNGNRGWAAVVVASILTMLAATLAPAQTYSVLYTFTGGTDGGFPFAGLVADSAGNLYGTTLIGGGTSGCVGQGCGVVFKVDQTGTETTLYAFTGGLDGGEPYDPLVRDGNGNLYGTTYLGGSTNFGVVFDVDSSGSETVLHNFTGAPDGANPEGGLLRDGSGNLYGTTDGGGTGHGIVFRLSPSGREVILHSFAGGSDGSVPHAGLIKDNLGNLYGTTIYGGTYNEGTVFQVSANGIEKVLYSFTGGTDGAQPWGRLVRDSAGNLYGTTAYGGPFGTGVVFQLDASGNETVLDAVGGVPIAGLTRDPAGNLYGTTIYGGDVNCNLGEGCGIVFELNKQNTLDALYTFTGGTDGGVPYGGLLAFEGNLYGTATVYGNLNYSCGEGRNNGCGVVFKISPK